jgi:hypothetical protein
MLKAPDVVRPEPRWPAVLTVFASAVLHYSLPPSMRVGPPWLVVTLVSVLVVAAWLGRRTGHHVVNERAAYGIIIVLGGALLYGVVALMVGLVHHTLPAPDLLRSSAILWGTNVFAFAFGYWRLDGGGPNERERRTAHTQGAFLFPQMAFCASGVDASLAELESWRPGFVDYLFVAFNTSTAFSPTDVPVLSAWAKIAMMVQAMISFTTVILLAARAVNIL